MPERPTFDWRYASEALPDLMQGLRVTVLATFWGMLLALALGLVWAMLRRSRRKWIAMPAALVVEFVRSTPLLVQIYFIYYVVLPSIPVIPGALSPFYTGVISLGVHYSAYTSEVYRAGIEAVARGQWEAARALNLTHRQTFRHIVLPQAIPPVVPALGNYFIAMFKDTPMLSAIAVMEMLEKAKDLGSQSFKYLELYTMVGALFLIVSLLASTGVRWLEGRLAVRNT